MKIVLQYNYCIAGREVAGLYCSLGKKSYCRGSAVLQYTAMYCDRQWSKGEAVSRHGQARAQQGSATRRWALRRGTGAGRTAWACCWVVGYALGAFSLFLTRFDSVLFLSQFLDIVHVLGS